MRLLFIFNWAFDENKTNRIYQSGFLFCQINTFLKKLKTKKESYKVIVFSTISAKALPGLKELPQFPGVPVKKPIFKIL